ncbi:MAG: hypothetical protein QXR81_08155 [Candidatus Nezhaarchaeales archaeon]
MLCLVCGDLGSGKTLFLTYLAVKNPISTYTVNFTVKGVKRLHEPRDLLRVREGMVLIDEAYTWLESRLSTSELNRFLTHIFFTSRKRRLDFVVASQLLDAVDVRLRRLSDIVIEAEGATDDGFMYTLFTRSSYAKFMLPMKVAEKLFSLYDTYELPEEEDKLANVERLAEEYLKEGLSVARKAVEYWLVKKGYSKSLAEYVYQELKLRGKR